jgi:hypothetical protein
MELGPENIIKKVEEKILKAKDQVKIYGRIDNISSVYITCYLPDASVGDYVVIHTPRRSKRRRSRWFQRRKSNSNTIRWNIWTFSGDES